MGCRVSLTCQSIEQPGPLSVLPGALSHLSVELPPVFPASQFVSDHRQLAFPSASLLVLYVDPSPLSLKTVLKIWPTTGKPRPRDLQR